MTPSKLLSAAAIFSALMATPALAQTMMPGDTGGVYNMQDPSTYGGQPDSRAASGGSIGHVHRYGYVAGYPDSYAYAPGYRDSYAYAPGYGAGYRYHRSGFWPADVATDVVGSAVGLAGAAVTTAGAIATAPFRAAEPRGAYAAMDDSTSASCAQRFRSYDPASGTYLGYDGKRHPCI